MASLTFSPFAPAPGLATFPHLAGPRDLGCLGLTSCETSDLEPQPATPHSSHTYTHRGRSGQVLHCLGSGD